MYLKFRNPIFKKSHLKKKCLIITALLGGLFSLRDRWKKLSQPLLLHFPFGIGFLKTISWAQFLLVLRITKNSAMKHEFLQNNAMSIKLASFKDLFLFSFSQEIDHVFENIFRLENKIFIFSK